MKRVEVKDNSPWFNEEIRRAKNNKKKKEKLSRHLSESPSEVGSDLGAFLVPSPEGDSEAILCCAIF